MDKLDPIAAAANYGGSTAAVGSAVLFGMTDAQWLVLTGIVGMVVAIVGCLLQLWIGWHKVQGYKSIRRAAERRWDESAEEHRARLLEMGE